MLGGLALLLTLLLAGEALARGGGGCLEEGTPVLTPDGPVPIERLAPGDAVLTVRSGKLCRATVVARTRVEPEVYLEFTCGDRTLRVTSEHPLAVAPGAGVFRLASTVSAGDRLIVWDGDGVRGAAVTSVRRVPALRPAYNLMVSPGGTFLAGGLLVHNKGCFLPDTPILRADGTAVPIRDVRPGDDLLAYTADGAITHAAVREVLVHEVEEYVEVATASVTLRVTAEHPFYVGNGTFRTLESLAVGDRIWVCDGRGLRDEPIVSLRRVAERTRVYNLRTDEPHTYFASGVAVHNKGGGGGGGGGGGSHSSSSGGFHSSSGSSGSQNAEDVLPTVIIFGFIGICVALVFVKVIVASPNKGDENLDFSYSPSQVAPKAEKTRQLLEFIARQDPSFTLAALEQVTRTTFLRLQVCWQARDYGPMKPLMMPDLYAEHVAQIAGMVRNHEIDIIEGVAIDRVDLVNVRYTEKPDQREFTALISARARDYYVDDRTRAFLRGDEAPAKFQEFWTFQWQGDAWLLRQIEQTRESDVLKEENFFEQFTDHAVDTIYAGKGGEGPAGPWLEKPVETKATRIDRLLNFLVQTDKLWTRQAMLDRAREVFLKVFLATESGDPAQVPAADLFPEAAAHLQDEIRGRIAAGAGISFRNLCVRKVDLVLVRNFSDNTKDEYTVLISAHAQKVRSQNGQVVSQDEYVTPFEQFWTFGRLDGQWKLKEVEPPARGRQMLAEESVDEGSSQGQMEWFYQHKRAV
jgi:predicted lipid-binding transport protein (Tim44 family)/uncharacterized membrane protein YgcG